MSDSVSYLTALKSPQAKVCSNWKPRRQLANEPSLLDRRPRCGTGGWARRGRADVDAGYVSRSGMNGDGSTSTCSETNLSDL